ncbi:hypothetical protein Bca4012_076611 [Brassica carinata]
MREHFIRVTLYGFWVKKHDPPHCSRFSTSLQGVSRTPPFARALRFRLKANTLERMHSPTGEKLDRIIREEKEKGVPITPSVLRC